ncbi:iron-containing alcohol dehydrogenase [Sphingomonas bacterium]|uniref:iron-containing alcohol dehydrogenase n=1 Tax=Sphingomonas bacterium TaxID=1895847 RepID=UPI001C2D0201|nr:iron-containing alcohol dehydrogenase [Sphingomonas bacterium]
MGSALSLPRLVFGAGSLAGLPAELALLGVTRPLLLTDRGLERAGLVAMAQAVLPDAATFLDVPENPTAAGADAALAAYRAGGCDGVVAMGGGSVLDTGKIVAALAAGDLPDAAALIGHPELIRAVAPLVAIPTTVGTGSESSPVAALHLVAGGPGFGTRHPLLVPRVAVCDPDLTRTLPRRLIAATAIDALSHCIEGFFAEPVNPVVDALALDGAARVVADVRAALAPEGERARASLMAAAFAGGAAIHKGLGPAHAIAFVCGDQDVHHGILIGVALPHTTRMVARHVPGKAAKLAAAIGFGSSADSDAGPGAGLADALAALVASLGLPATLTEAGYRLTAPDASVEAMVRSHFNRTSPYAPNAAEYGRLVEAIT